MHYLYTFTFSAIMKATKALLCLFFGMCFITSIQAQFELPKYKDVQELKNRQLIVLISEPCDDLKKKMDKINDPKLMGECNRDVAHYNDLIKQAVEKFWTFNSKDVLYKTSAELNEIMKDKSIRSKYVVMFCFSITNTHDLDWKTYDGGKDGMHITTGQPYFGIAYPDESPVYRIEMPNAIPSEYDLSYAVSSTNYIFNYILNHKADAELNAVMNDNEPVLSQKTLLILKDDVSPTIADGVGKYYPGKFRLVTYDEMTKAVNEGAPDCAYLLKNENNTADGVVLNWVINCADGATLTYVKSTARGGFNSGDKGYTKDFFDLLAEIYRAERKK
jgi:hypothetical protein